MVISSDLLRRHSCLQNCQGVAPRGDHFLQYLSCPASGPLSPSRRSAGWRGAIPGDPEKPPPCRAQFASATLDSFRCDVLASGPRGSDERAAPPPPSSCCCAFEALLSRSPDIPPSFSLWLFGVEIEFDPCPVPEAFLSWRLSRFDRREQLVRHTPPFYRGLNVGNRWATSFKRCSAHMSRQLRTTDIDACSGKKKKSLAMSNIMLK